MIEITDELLVGEFSKIVDKINIAFLTNFDDKLKKALRYISMKIFVNCYGFKRSAKKEYGD